MLRVLVAIASMVAAAWAIYVLSRDIIPPKTLTFAAGIEGGGYWSLAQQYADILAEDGIEVTVIETGGSVENAALLASGDVQVALMQGGVVAAPRTEALGAIFLEPVWVFAAPGYELPANAGAWDGVTVAAGGEGSGTRAAFDALAFAAGLREGQVVPLPLSGADAADAMRAGEVDVAFFVAPYTSAYLQQLLVDEAVSLIALDQVDALSRGLPEAEVVTLPQGGLRMFPPLPEQDLEVIAMVARLDAQRSLHPTLVDRLVEAARRIHGGQDALTATRAFPSTDTGTRPMDRYAHGLIEGGTSSLQEYLPYWIVAQISRVAILIVPLVLFLLPLLRALPGLYRWSMRSRVYRYYTEIRDIDQGLDAIENEAELMVSDERLLAIDREIAGLSLPVPYRNYAYSARMHLDLVRNRIRERMERPRG